LSTRNESNYRVRPFFRSGMVTFGYAETSGILDNWKKEGKGLGLCQIHHLLVSIAFHVFVEDG
jgi:hypothetical protein